MVCVYCDSPTYVINSRHQRRSNNIWRRRKCDSCGGIFTTHETTALEGTIVLQKSAGSLVPFSKENLFISIYESCKHRQTSIADAAALTQTIIDKALPQSTSGVLQRNELIAVALAVLRRFDKTAATVYEAYHPSS